MPQIPSWIIARFPPEQRAAVDFLRPFIDEDLLREIAAADYGIEAQAHYEALEPIWQGADLKSLHSYYPAEVLELMRWSEPEDENWKPGSTGIRGHKIRAFSCAVLLAAGRGDMGTETLIQLLESSFQLGTEALTCLGRFLIWKLERLGREEYRPFYALAVTAICCTIKSDMEKSEVAELADWLLQEERDERAYLGDYSEERMFLGLCFPGTLDSKWETLIARIKKENHGRPLGDLLPE